MKDFSAAEFRDRERDPSWEMELKLWLQQKPEGVRFDFLMELMQFHLIVGLILASNTLVSRTYYVRLLEHAVSTCDASSIKYWLRTIVPRLGFRRSVDLLIKLCQTKRSGVEKAAYWMDKFARSEKDLDKLNELQKVLDS